ncbi:helix-turn-helix domain-containing protein [Streptomyces bungoensis]|uniref:helix-turn-helix domain-containing protein n=1 Tax=Streptomyces bungoensis TaxID=285568 RepID=UPI003403F4BD
MKDIAPTPATRGRRNGYGVIHENTRHTTRFTVVGNHLAQHPEMSLVAIALAVHIQSLASNAPVDIKTLAERFPEGRDRIASGLRELEAHGNLRRERERAPTGRIVTRTISCNQPKAPRDHTPEKRAARLGAPREPRKQHPMPPVPQPAYPSPALLQTAIDPLADLHRDDRRLLLSACDTAHLAPGVATWLQREVPATAVRRALTDGLPPEPLRRPAALLAHRLGAQLPPPPPFRAPAAPPPSVPHRMQNCDGCDRGFRAPAPGLCAECRAATREPGGSSSGSSSSHTH